MMRRGGSQAVKAGGMNVVGVLGGGRARLKSREVEGGRRWTKDWRIGQVDWTD